MENEQELIALITKQVLARLGIRQGDDMQPDTLAIFTGFVFNEEAVSAYLKKKESVTCVLFGEAAYSNPLFGYVNAKTRDEKQRLVSSLDRYSSVVVVTPPLSFIKTAASSDDSTFESMLALRPLLWGKDVTLLLDFSLPRFKRGFSGLSDSLDALEQMGMAIQMLADKADSGRKDLVTEQDIKDAAKLKQDRIRIMPEAIVTELARDTAKELGIRIEL